jgi:hypothetical protein
MKITILKERPRGKTKAYEQFKLYRNNRTVGKVMEMGGDRRMLTRDVRKGYISVKLG